MTKKGLIVSVLIGIAIFSLIIAGISYIRMRGNDNLGLCLVCHELFVPYEAYKGADYNRTRRGVGIGCAECHMHPYEEFKKSPHYTNASGVRPSCTACHEPHTFTQIVRWKFLYINRGGYGDSPFHRVLDSIRDKVMWEELRPQMAKKVRDQLLKTNSQRCWNCHGTRYEARLANIKQHKKAIEKRKVDRLNCIECHYNLVHAEVKWPEMEEGGEKK